VEKEIEEDEQPLTVGHAQVVRARQLCDRFVGPVTRVFIRDIFLGRARIVIPIVLERTDAALGKGREWPLLCIVRITMRDDSR